jgi:hypothetical protein
VRLPSVSEAPAAVRPSPTYRLATPDDIPAISKLHRGAPEALYRHEYWTRMPEKAAFMTAWLGGELVGTQAFIPYVMHVDGQPMLTGRSERTLVSSTLRGGNVFQMMMHGCVEHGTAHGEQFFWGATTTAIRAFKKTGFLRVTGHRRYLTAGVSARNVARAYRDRGTRPSFSPSELARVARTRDAGAAVRYAKSAWAPLSVAARALAGRAGTRRDEGYEVRATAVPDVALDPLYEALRGPKGRMFRIGLEPDFFDWMVVQGRHATKTWVALRGGEPRAYLIGLFDDPVEARVLDFAAADEDAFALVVDQFRAAADAGGQAFMRAIVNPLCPQQATAIRGLRRAGFTPLYTGGNSVVRAGRYEDMNVLAEPSAWYITDLWFLTSADDTGPSE